MDWISTRKAYDLLAPSERLGFIDGLWSTPFSIAVYRALSGKERHPGMSNLLLLQAVDICAVTWTLQEQLDHITKITKLIGWRYADS